MSFRILSNTSLRYVAWCVALVLALVQIWAFRHSLNPDGISYLDIARYVASGHFAASINAYWSPLYSWLLAAGLWLSGASRQDHFIVARAVNFVILIAALFAFEFLLRECFVARRRFLERSPARASLSEQWVLFLAYCAFGAATLGWIRVHNVSPDLLVAVLVFIASGLTVRIATRGPTSKTLVALGATLGLAYLAKTAMLPLAFAFIIPTMLLTPQKLRSAVLITASLAALVLPYAIAISMEKGRPTFGDVAKLNYAWFVEDVRIYKHWQGEDPKNGVPAHPTRRLLEHPRTYEFAAPLQGTYPVWYDPSYWHEGLEVAPDPVSLWRRFLAELDDLQWIFGKLIWPVIALVGLVAVRKAAVDRERMVVTTVPLLAAVALYSLVHTEPRFFGGFMAVALTGLVMTIQPISRATRRFAVVSVFILAVIVSGDVVEELTYIADQFEGRAGTDYVATADAVRQSGVRPGATIGFIGDSFRAYWAYVGGYRIGAEVSPREFWSVRPHERARAVGAILQSGIPVILADLKVDCPAHEGWARLPGTTLCQYVKRRETRTRGRSDGARAGD